MIMRRDLDQPLGFGRHHTAHILFTREHELMIQDKPRRGILRHHHAARVDVGALV